jgi:hypothetical protein
MTKIEIGKTYKFTIDFSIYNGSVFLTQRYAGKQVFLHYKNYKGVNTDLIYHDSFVNTYKIIIGKVQEIELGKSCSIITLTEDSIRCYK